jgi:hypothetical protein
MELSFTYLDSIEWWGAATNKDVPPKGQALSECDHPLLIMHLKNYGTPRLVNSAKLTDVTPTVRSEESKSSI